MIGVYKSTLWGDHRDILDRYGITYRRLGLDLSSLPNIESSYEEYFRDKRLLGAKEAKELIDILSGVDIKLRNHILYISGLDLLDIELTDKLEYSLYYGVIYQGECGSEIYNFLMSSR